MVTIGKILIIGLMWILPGKVFSTDLEQPIRIAKWFDNHQSAVSLRFDDNIQSHIDIVIPLLKQYNFHATFMVNPGRKSYKKNKEFWEKQLPKMGHRLGNHTMNHRGAKNLEQADYEIGTPARLIWSLYPQESKLMVFASGGGAYWGGAKWEKGGREMVLHIVNKYHLIDLYDGKHPSARGDGNVGSEKLCEKLTQAVQEEKHQPFHFHNIGKPTLKDRLRKLQGKTPMSMPELEFEAFLDCLDQNKEKIWIAPLVQVLKYETEYNSARLEPINDSKSNLMTKLVIDTDPDLYDQPLTLIFQPEMGRQVKSVSQNNKPIDWYRDRTGRTVFNVSPRNSVLSIRFENSIS